MSEIVKKFIADKFVSTDGVPVHPGNMGDVHEFARDLGSFLYQLHRLPTDGAVKPSFDNDFAGNDLIFFAAEFMDLLEKYQKIIPIDFLEERFEQAARRPWTKNPVWVIGQFVPKNLRVADGKLVGVEVVAQAVSGDPAFDLALAWSLFDEKARKIFFSAAEADEATINRARIFALQTALKNYQSADIDELIQSRDATTEILKDFNYTIAQDMY